ncbi:sugar kinase [Muricomes intestini]|jgi:2-dehydro-3-deoxygluconokinase|uniref:2-keto-3-deoxygluconate kinase n=2 Tax=Muricomes intestini TaxID=1796634 RepID=A0A4R3K576_9FIRM|nr:sugar kinase [Muricomes intestini]TCS77857.1 2-keto-3-deoxygluconate kinase [Muricomes intestini]HAX50450.1 2-dehydro-3-deoxygluconokinase [Lachnospiraceae bacterium]HCR84847.1 2-dehydro-3-deoxygluconokinase [Lachnospiraceae bacterium]
MSKSVILIGEPLGLLIAQNEGPLENVSGYSLAVAGAEFNVAVGLARLEHNVTYFTKLGNDPFGKLVTNVIKQNQIGTEFIQYSDERTTGFMLKSMVSSGDPEIFYYRKNSAASTLSKKDIDQINLKGYNFLHLTGILPALSTSTREAVFYLIEKARKRNLLISFDPNLRPQLWESRDMMITTINKLAALSNIVFPGENEGEILCGSKNPKIISKFYHNLGVKTVVTKLGSRGAYISDGNNEAVIPGFPVKKVVDTVGAGDGFAAGVISALIEGCTLSDAVLRGNAIGAIQVMNRGDNDGLPNRDTLMRFMEEGTL